MTNDKKFYFFSFFLRMSKILRTFAPQSAHWGPRGFSILGESGGIGCPFIKRSGINPCTPIVERDVYLCSVKIIDNKIIILMMKKFLFLPLLLIAMAVMVSAETPSLVPAMIVYGTDGSRQVVELDATNVTDLIVLQHGQSLSVDIPEAQINGIRSISFSMVDSGDLPSDVERAEDTLVRSVEKIMRDEQVILRLHTQDGGVVEYDIRGNKVITNK